MTLHRFFVSPEAIKSARVFFNAETSKQITKVLRLKRGNRVVVLDGSGKEYLVDIEQLISDAVSGKVISQSNNKSEPKTIVTLYQALTPRDKFETVLQKGTEVGISRFVPVETKRSLLKSIDLKPEKMDRFLRIIQESAEQSERGVIPSLGMALKFEEAIKIALDKGAVILAWEYEKKNTLTTVSVDLINSKEIGIFIGPEGGFEEQEIRFAIELGATAVTLGPRVLRTETAGPLMAALILFSKGDLDAKRV